MKQTIFINKLARRDIRY